jgi:hypothetical protein
MSSSKRSTEVARREFLLKQIPEKRRALVERAFNASCSPRMAIKANCFICSGMDAEQAKRCSVVLCALYEYNPYRKTVAAAETTPDDTEEAETAD